MPMHLLIAEDSPVSREILRQILRPLPGYVSEFAADGEEAWTHLQDRPEAFDAVILDVLMPKLGGFDVLARMRLHPVLKTKPVILCTALGDRISVAQAARFSVEHYIVKPYAKSTLLDKLGHIKDMRERKLNAESPATVCERLGVAREDLESMRRALAEEVENWLNHAASVGARPAIRRFLLAANGLRGSALTLGNHSLADALFQAEAGLERLDGEIAAFPRAIFPGMITELIQPVAVALKVLREDCVAAATRPPAASL